MNKPIDITGVVLETQRLVLRPWQEADLADFYEYARMDGVGQMAGWLPHKDMEESRQILARFIAEKKTFAIVLDGKAIGSVGVEFYHEQEFPELATLQGREIGYAMSRDYWGRGIMPEAVQAVIGWLFACQGLDFVLCAHFDWNRQSARVIEKCGFQYLKNTVSHPRTGTTETTCNYILHNAHAAKN